MLPIIRWVYQVADVEFELPTLPQFSQEDRALYKEQVAAREKYRREHGLDVEARKDEL